MTLHVHAYCYHAVTQRRDWISLGPGKNLFGFEVCRRELSGHEAVASIGVKILTKLRDQGWLLLEAEQELEILEQDVLLIREHITHIYRKQAIQMNSFNGEFRFA